MISDEAPLMVKCPQCKQPSLYHTDNPYRPFCSAKCKLEDTAAWAEGKYNLPRSLNQDDEEMMKNELP